MKRKYLILITLVFLAATLTVFLSGCSGGNDVFDGRTIVTFDFNDQETDEYKAKLEIGKSGVYDEISYAYVPGTLVKDPTEFYGYKFIKSGYIFTGWYTSPDCKPDEKWDFTKTYIDEEAVTLYAGWELKIQHTFTVCYVDENGKIHTLGKPYTVKAGTKFNDLFKYANKREGYTSMGYYQDEACTIPWNSDYTHPGGDEDLDVKVFVKHIKGDWVLVSNYSELVKAVKSSVTKDIYLTSNIDCEGNEFYVTGSFNRIFEGNGYKISNFTANKHSSTYKPICSIFDELAAGAEVRNVNFENVTFNFNRGEKEPPIEDMTLQVASLAAKVNEDVKVTEVSVSGVFNTDYDVEFPGLENGYFEYTKEGATLDPGSFKVESNITIIKN